MTWTPTVRSTKAGSDERPGRGRRAPAAASIWQGAAGILAIGVLLVAMPMPIIFQFAPGRVHHDNWQFIFATLAVGALIRPALRPDSCLPAVVAAVAFAMALWVGAVCLPWLMAFNLALALLW